MPRIPITAAKAATPAGLSAPLRGAVTFGGVTEFVGVAPAVPFKVIEGVPVLFADGITPLETLTLDPFADTCAKPEVAVTIVGADVVTTVAFSDEETEEKEEGYVDAGVTAGVTACAVAEYADTSSSTWLTRGAISCLTSVASACRKLVMTGWREDGMSVTQGGSGAEVAVM